MAAQMTAIKRLALLPLEVEKAILKDQLSAGLWAFDQVKELARMALPYISDATIKVGDTLTNMVLSQVRTAINKMERHSKVNTLIMKLTSSQGPDKAMSVIQWVKDNDEMLKDYPIQSVLILDSIVSKKQYYLLDLVISLTKGYLKSNKAIHQLYAAILIEPNLPSHYLEDAIIGNDAAAATVAAVESVGVEWWVNEFMSKIILFPKCTFYEYFSLFFKVFPTVHHNRVLEILKVPRDHQSETLPFYIQYHLIFLDNIVLEYILKDPDDSAELRLQYRYHGERWKSLAALEFYLEISGFMQRFLEHPKSTQVTITSSWIKETFINDEKSRDQIFVHDYNRILKVLLTHEGQEEGGVLGGRNLDSYLEKSIRHCSPLIYSTLLLQTPRKEWKRLSSVKTCDEIQHIDNVMKSIKVDLITNRCADIIAKVNTILLEGDIVEPKRKGGGSPPPILKVFTAGTILEYIFKIDRDDDSTKNFLKNSANANVRDLVNEALQSFCQRQCLWAANKIVYQSRSQSQNQRQEKSKEQSPTNLERLILGPSMAKIQQDQILLPKENYAQTIKNALVDFIEMDNRRDFSFLLRETLRKGKLGLVDYEELTIVAVKYKRFTIFSQLIEAIVNVFFKTNQSQVLMLLEKIRNDSKEFRQLVRNYNFQTLGVKN